MRCTGGMLFSGIVLAISSPMLVAASTPVPPRTVEIPGPVRSVAAPDGSGARIFYRAHMTPDGQDSPVFYDDGHGRVQQIGTLLRSMVIGWSPDGKRAFLQDYLGSNVADCYVMTRTAEGIIGLSLLKLAQRTPGHPSGDETPTKAHYYVHCDHWRSSEQIVGTIAGHTDPMPEHEFVHSFAYDARTHRITWRR